MCLRPDIQPMVCPLLVAGASQTPVLVKRKKLGIVSAASLEVHHHPFYRAKYLDDRSCVACISSQDEFCELAQLAHPARLVPISISPVEIDEEDVLFAIFYVELSEEERNKMRRQKREEKAHRLREAALGMWLGSD